MSYNMLDTQLLTQSEGHKKHFVVLYYAHVKLNWFPGLSGLRQRVPVCDSVARPPTQRV